ncbi:MAG TPA: DUF2752 domain-containing protein [Planctomycetota bacterium]
MSHPPGIPPPAPPRGTWLRALGFGGALVVGLTATVTPEAATWFGLRGPDCLLGRCFGPLACPGCGLVRSTAAALQGEPGFAVALHPAGPVVALVLVGGLLLDLDVLRRRVESATHRCWRRAGVRLFTVAVLVGWAARCFSP